MQSEEFNLEKRDTEFKRVLVVNQQSIDADNATGITLRSLWAEWPRECVMEVCIDIIPYISSSGISKIYAHQSNILKLARSKAGGTANAFMKSSHKTENTFSSRIRSLLRQYLVSYVMSLKAILNQREFNLISQFKPDVIYSLGSNVTTLKLVNELSEILEIPVVIHFMDNWAEHLQWDSNPLIKPYKRELQKQLLSCIKHSTNAIAISDSMAEHYNEILGLKMHTMMNSVDIRKMECKAKEYITPLRFVYAGGLHLERWQALKEVAMAINKSKTGTLLIYSGSAGQYRGAFEGLPVVFKNPVSHENIKSVYENADVLVHVEKADPQKLGFFKYSISTKIPEYLACGRPILFYGPRGMGLFEYLSDNQAALCATNEEELIKCMAFLKNHSFMNEMIDNAKMLAREKHDAVLIRERLKDAINYAVEHQG